MHRTGIIKYTINCRKIEVHYAETCVHRNVSLFSINQDKRSVKHAQIYAVFIAGYCARSNKFSGFIKKKKKKKKGILLLRWATISLSTMALFPEVMMSQTIALKCWETWRKHTWLDILYILVHTKWYLKDSTETISFFHDSYKWKSGFPVPQ
jgi:hypothetical protein